MAAEHLRDPRLAWSSFLLSKPFWTVAAGNNVDVTVVAFDDKVLKDVTLYYRVGNESWVAASLEDTSVSRIAPIVL